MRGELLRIKLETYMDNGWIREDKSANTLVPFFRNKALHNLETARILLKLSEEESLKAQIGIREDYEGYDWVISAAYYAMYHTASGALARINLRSTNHEAVIYALEYIILSIRKLYWKKIIYNSLRTLRHWKIIMLTDCGQQRKAELLLSMK